MKIISHCPFLLQPPPPRRYVHHRYVDSDDEDEPAVGRRRGPQPMQRTADAALVHDPFLFSLAKARVTTESSKAEETTGVAASDASAAAVSGVPSTDSTHPADAVHARIMVRLKCSTLLVGMANEWVVPFLPCYPICSTGGPRAIEVHP